MDKFFTVLKRNEYLSMIAEAELQGIQFDFITWKTRFDDDMLRSGDPDKVGLSGAI